MKKKLKLFTLYADWQLVTQSGRDIWDAVKKAEQNYRYVRKPDNNGSSSYRAYYRKLAKRAARHYPGIHRRSIKIASGKAGWFAYRYGVFEYD